MHVATNTRKPEETLDSALMSPLQIWVVGMTIFLNALDGFDLLSISFAAPGIANEWQVTRAALGVVLSMELIGMGIGALLFGGIADRFGRKPAAIGCLAFMLFGMVAATFAQGVFSLSIYRVITGIGLGGMLAVNNAIVSEFSSAKRRRLCISLMVIGFSLGGVFGGLVATNLLAHYDWRSVFYFGSAVTALCIPLVWFTVPESLPWLCRKRPTNALLRINTILNKFGHTSCSELPPIEVHKQNARLKDIFTKHHILSTTLITIAYLLHSVTFYFTLKWAPKIVADLGYHPSTAGTVLVWGNVGGVLGGILFGYLAQRFRLKGLYISVLILSSVTLVLFGNTATSLLSMSFFNALNGFFCVSGLAGAYAAMATIYPTHVRGFGTGFTLSIGRAGAIISPIMAGLLFSIDLSLPAVSIVMAIGSLLAAVALIPLQLDKQNP
jgi:benzoate transport